MGGGPQRRILTSLAGLGSHFYPYVRNCARLVKNIVDEERSALPGPCISYRDHVSSNVANTTSPALGRVVEHVVDADAIIFLDESVEVFLQQNILGRDVGKDEVDFGLVAGSTTTDDGTNDLKHGSNTRASSDHAKVADHVRGVDEGALGALYADILAQLEGRHVLRDVAGGIGFDEQVEVAWLVVARDRGIGSHNLLGAAVGLLHGRADGDVLADGKAKDGRGRRESEAVAIEDAADELAP